jgi:chemosensory pili system protein ChpA (sensor histidine kinase/response regulator)
VNDPAIASGPLVLVADDDPALRSLFQRALERSGLRVVLATNGREALELLETHDIRVCLFDLNMPNLDGLATLREIRADHRLRAMPVILVTGSDAESASLRAIGDGANDCISKPVGLEELAARVWAQLPPPH